jgi:hypothetical protein
MAFTYDTDNIQLGAGKLWVDTGSGEAPVGLTMDAQIVTYEPTYHDIMGNETGEALLDRILKGEKMKIAFTLMEHTNENFERLFPLATKYTGSGTTYGFGRKPFASLIDEAVKVHFHPINQSGSGGVDDETVLTFDWYFWKCVHSGTATVEYTKDGIRAFKVEMDVYLDDTKTAGYQLAMRGDPANTTIDITPPTIASVKEEKSNVLTANLAGTELTGVDVDTNIELVFSEELDSGSALNYKNCACFTASTDAIVDWSAAAITYTAATKTVLINPVASLAGSTSFRLVISGYKDVAGNLIVPVERRFATT